MGEPRQGGEGANGQVTLISKINDSRGVMYIIEVDDREEIERIVKALKNKNAKMRLTIETENKNLYAALLRHYKARAYVIR